MAKHPSPEFKRATKKATAGAKKSGRKPIKKK